MLSLFELSNINIGILKNPVPEKKCPYKVMPVWSFPKIIHQGYREPTFVLLTVSTCN